MLGRRGALFGLLAAPMIVRTPGLLMPVKRTPCVGYPWLTNRTIRHWMDVTAIRDRNVLLAPDDMIVGNFVFRGVPIREMDALRCDEARVT